MTMSKQETLAKWKEVSNLIASEISNNEEFAQKMERILKGETVAVTSKRRSRRSPAKLDPFHLLEMGEEILAKELEKLNVEELKDIVSEYGIHKHNKRAITNRTTATKPEDFSRLNHKEETK